MKECSKCHTTKPLSDFYSQRADCKICVKARALSNHHANKDARNAKRLEHQKANPEQHRLACKKYDSANAGVRRDWYERNKELIKVNQQKYQKDNPGICNAINAKRRAAKLQRTPRWLTETHQQQIGIFYDAASQLTREFGVKMEVDHIVPLQGKNVSGLHVPWNLQVLPKPLNCKKKNLYE